MKYLIALWTHLKPAAPPTRWEDYLDPDEPLLWHGAPASRTTMRLGYIGLSIFGFPFLLAGLGIVGSGLFLPSGTGIIGDMITRIGLIAFGLPFLGIGLGLCVGLWVYTLTAHAFVRYAVTDRRVYVATSWWTHQIAVYTVPRHAQISLRRGRRDTVNLQYADGKDGSDAEHIRVELTDIPDGHRVYALLRTIQAAQRD